MPQNNSVMLSNRETQYFCPMHPEVVQDKPGSCPKCGMDLDALWPTQKGQEHQYMRRELWVAISCSIVLLAIMLLRIIFSAIGELPVVTLLLATPVCLWSALPLYRRGYHSVINRSLNMFTLITLGVSVAYWYSAVVLLARQIAPEGILAASHLYFDGAAIIVTLVLVGQRIEGRARSRARSALYALLENAPKSARIIDTDGNEKNVPIAEVKIGNLVRILPGEKVVVDGTITEGESYVEQAMITGEPYPVHKTAGEALYAGTQNGNGSMIMRAEKIGAETLSMQIGKMVLAAQQSRAPIQNLVDRISAYFVWAVLVVALVTLLTWWLLAPQQIALGVRAAISVLVIACPCALGLATPMSIMVANGRAAQCGILFRDSEALQSLARATIMVFDKTGTLTIGKPQVQTCQHLSSLSDHTFIQYAASVELLSEHPLAGAVVALAKAQAIPTLPASEFQAYSGKGVQAVVAQQQVTIGQEKWLQKRGIISTAESKLMKAAAHNRAEGATVIYVALGKELAGFFAISDPLREEAQSVVKALNASKCRPLLLSGDNQDNVSLIGNRVGIKKVVANQLPNQKLTFIRELQEAGEVVAMVGDGINDAPALAQANIGIAMGSGSDIALESSHITLVRPNLQALLEALSMSRAVRRNIAQNLFFAFIYNTIGVVIAAGVLWPWLGILLTPPVAALAMTLSSISVILNALRLRFAISTAPSANRVAT